MELLTLINEENYAYYKVIVPESVKDYYESDSSTTMLGIESFGEAAGAIVLKLDGTNAELIWLGLLPKFQGLGIMDGIMVDMLRILGNVGVKWVGVTIHKDTNRRFIKLLSGYNFRYTKTNRATWNTTLNELRQVKALGVKASHCIGLHNAKSIDIKRLNSEILENNAALVDIPVDVDKYDKCSSMYVKNSIPEAVMLVENKEENLHIAYLYSKENHPEALIEVMASSLENCSEYDKDTTVSANLVNPSIEGMIERMNAGTLEYSVYGTLKISGN